MFWILGSVSDSRKCFWILGSVLAFWEVFWHSRKCFGILGSVLDSGKCFVPMGHRTIHLLNNCNPARRLIWETKTVAISLLRDINMVSITSHNSNRNLKQGRRPRIRKRNITIGLRTVPTN